MEKPKMSFEEFANEYFKDKEIPDYYKEHIKFISEKLKEIKPEQTIIYEGGRTSGFKSLISKYLRNEKTI